MRGAIAELELPGDHLIHAIHHPIRQNNRHVLGIALLVDCETIGLFLIQQFLPIIFTEYLWQSRYSILDALT